MFKKIWAKLFGTSTDVHYKSKTVNSESHTVNGNVKIRLNGKVIYDGPKDKMTPEAKAVMADMNAMKENLRSSMKDIFKD